ncbi:glucoamylase family protein [Singulisphaera sp. PoT]|uniref:glucoamylase family protein n=1 Tax=Singulisphaera sp. PoT TaxID=3411797 RepID=UPI003BF4A6C5
MSMRTIVAMAALILVGATAATASPNALGPSDRDLLSTYARDTWHSIDAMFAQGELPTDEMRRQGDGWTQSELTSPTNIAAYLWSVIAAEDLHIISREDAGKRLERVLQTLDKIERSHGFYFNWYDASSGRRARVWPGGVALRPFLSSVDNGWLAVALIVVGNARPDLRDTTDALLKDMNFGFFYDPYDPNDPIAHPGLLRGGYFTDSNTYTDFHYGTLNTEPRIASYVAIARGQIPVEHYYRMIRAHNLGRDGRPAPTRTYAGVPVVEGNRHYRNMNFVPSWDGTMFEALMVPLFVPEAEWAPGSWGANHPLYVRAQIEYGLRDARLGYWGISASTDPGGGYRAYGVAELGSRDVDSSRKHESIITPHATFLAMQYSPVEAVANLRTLTQNFPLYGPYGFYDSVDVHTGQVAERVLILDQGMIMASLSNVIGGDVLRRGFCSGPMEAVIRPLIAPERFEVGEVKPREPEQVVSREEPKPTLDSNWRIDEPDLSLPSPALGEIPETIAIISPVRDMEASPRLGLSATITDILQNVGPNRPLAAPNGGNERKGRRKRSNSTNAAPP